MMALLLSLLLSLLLLKLLSRGGMGGRGRERNR